MVSKPKAYNFSTIIAKGTKMAWIIMLHDVGSYLNQENFELRKSKVDKSDLLDTIGPSESLCKA